MQIFTDQMQRKSPYRHEYEKHLLELARTGKHIRNTHMTMDYVCPFLLTSSQKTNAGIFIVGGVDISLKL